MENPSQTDDRELARWLRYYRDLGFTHLYRREPAPAADVATDGVRVVPSASLRRVAETSPPPQKHAGERQPSLRAPGTQQNDLFTANAAQETLEQIRDDLGDCRRCKLWQGRKNIVFGSGNPKAELVFVGEGPGADEDEQGLPFVGRAGQLLTDMIEKGLKIRRADVYICNIIKCRPPGNRKPERDEVAACRQFVERQLDTVRPRVICALGSTAAETLLGTRESMGNLRGQWYEFHGIPLMVTYHPAFLLRDPSRKSETWADLKKILAHLHSSA